MSNEYKSRFEKEKVDISLKFSAAKSDDGMIELKKPVDEAVKKIITFTNSFGPYNNSSLYKRINNLLSSEDINEIKENLKVIIDTIFLTEDLYDFECIDILQNTFKIKNILTNDILKTINKKLDTTKSGVSKLKAAVSSISSILSKKLNQRRDMTHNWFFKNYVDEIGNYNEEVKQLLEKDGFRRDWYNLFVYYTQQIIPYSIDCYLYLYDMVDILNEIERFVFMSPEKPLSEYLKDYEIMEEIVDMEIYNPETKISIFDDFVFEMQNPDNLKWCHKIFKLLFVSTDKELQELKKEIKQPLVSYNGRSSMIITGLEDYPIPIVNIQDYPEDYLKILDNKRQNLPVDLELLNLMTIGAK